MNFRSLLALSAFGFAGLMFAAGEAPKLTAYERSQGWHFLFDGRDASDWRGYQANKLPAGWQIHDGSLVGNSGVIVSEQEFGDFELQFDWRVGAGGRGEVYFRVNEDMPIERSGPLMQLAGHGESIAGNGLDKPDRMLTPQFDVWYRSKIVVFGGQVEFHVNGERVAQFSISTAAWHQALGKEFARQTAGRIALAGERVEFRNVKVRSLSANAP